MDNDPTKYVDEWPINGLSHADRTKIKSELLKAHAVFYRSDFSDPYGFITPMEKAFNAIAAVLFNSKMLTQNILESDLPFLISIAAAEGKWADFAVDEILTKEKIQRFRFIYTAATAEWQSKLLEDALANPLPSAAPTITSNLSPKELEAAYRANFPDERIVLRDLCWAAGQHYREWKRWLAGELRDGSTPDLAFRRVLSSGKRPHEFKAKPRPKGWE